MGRCVQNLKSVFSVYDIYFASESLAGSRLLVKPLHSEKELIVALPQNRQFDHIKASDQLDIGWSEEAGIYFI